MLSSVLEMRLRFIFRLYLWCLLQIGEGSVTAVTSSAGGPGVKQRGDVLQEVGLPRPEGKLSRVVRVDIVVISDGQSHLDVTAGCGGGLRRVTITVITLETITCPARLTSALVMLPVPELDIKHALGLLVALVDVETVTRHRVAVISVSGLPASGAERAVRARASLGTTLSASRRAPGAVSA